MIIDISYFNTITDWNKVKESVDGIIIRMGYTGYGSGKCTFDKQYYNNLLKCEALAIPYGMYYFPASINRAEAEKEADFIYDALATRRPDLGVWLDSEIADVKTKKGRADNLSREKRTEFLHIIIERLKLLDIAAGVYASQSWLEHQLNMSELPGVPVWVAQYNAQHVCTYKGDYVLFQYSSKGKIPGIAGNVDLNVKHEETSAGVAEVLDSELSDAVGVIASRVITGYFGQGHEQRKENIYKLIRQRVNDILK